MSTRSASDLIAGIRDAVHGAAESGQKVAMLHYQVLLNADVLESVDPEQFCTLINVPSSFKTEFRKMISLARLIRQQGGQVT